MEVTDLFKNDAKKKVNREVAAGTFKGDREHYEKFLYHIAIARADNFKEWNAWRQEHYEEVSNQGIAFQSVNLEGARIENLRYEGVNLSGADLFGANFKNAELTKIIIDKKTDFGDVLLGDTVLSLHEDCNQKEAIKAISRAAEVNNVRFLDPVFGRKVRG